MSILLLSNMVPGNHRCEKHLFGAFKGKISKVGYIPAHTGNDKKYFESVQRHYLALGVDSVDYFDVDEEFNPKQFGKIFSSDLIHLCGGNTAYFLSCLQKRGILPDLNKFAASGKPLVGVSAGAIIMGKDIDIVFDEKAERDHRSLLDDTMGLGLYKFEFYPHFTGHSKESDVLKKRCLETGRKILACDDGSGILVSEKRTLPIGKVYAFEKGKRELIS